MGGCSTQPPIFMSTLLLLAFRFNCLHQLLVDTADSADSGDMTPDPVD